MKKQTKAIALCGVLGALAVTFLYFGSVTVFDITAVVLTALLTMVVRVELGHTLYPWLYAAATSVVSLLILPSKFIALVYLLAGAVYPLLKARFEQLRPLFSWILKLSVFDLMVLSLASLLTLGPGLELTEAASSAVSSIGGADGPTVVLVSGGGGFGLGGWGVIFAFLACTAAAVLYDVFLTKMVSLYILKIRKKLGLKKLF